MVKAQIPVPGPDVSAGIWPLKKNYMNDTVFASLQMLGARKFLKSILKAEISLKQGGASQLVQGVPSGPFLVSRTDAVG